MSKITSKVNALKGCVINHCLDEEEKKAMFICCDQIIEHVEKLEKQQECQLTVEEIDYLLNPHEPNVVKIADILMKLAKQKEMLNNVR